MNRVLRNNFGVALGVVLAIMGIVSVLATGMFYFSYNELNFARLDVDRARADYLARAGVEIASKSFSEVAGRFPDPVESDPVVMGPLYLHPDGDEDGNVISSRAAGSAGNVTVDVFEAERTIIEAGATATEDDKYIVWAYDATAEVGHSKAQAKGFSLPVAYVGDPDETAADVVQLGWIQKSGGSCYMIQPAEPDGALPVSALNGPSSIPVYINKYRGVLAVPETNGTLTMPVASGDKAYGWAASAVCFEGPIDLRRAQVLNVFIVSAPTVIFEKEIHLYIDNYSPRMGNIVVSISEDQSARVYFKENVYLHVGSTQVKVFDGGTAYDFGAKASGRRDIDFIQYAVDTGLVRGGLSSALRELFGAERQGGKYTAADLEARSDSAAPTVNSLIEVVWD